MGESEFTLRLSLLTPPHCEDISTRRYGHIMGLFIKGSLWRAKIQTTPSRRYAAQSSLWLLNYNCGDSVIASATGLFGKRLRGVCNSPSVQKPFRRAAGRLRTRACQRGS